MTENEEKPTLEVRVQEL